MQRILRLRPVRVSLGQVVMDFDEVYIQYNSWFPFASSSGADPGSLRSELQTLCMYTVGPDNW